MVKCFAFYIFNTPTKCT